MLARLKSYFYFPIASYFCFFALMRLRKWNPRIIVVTGSNGKTTLLHMLESQLREKAKFSHHANSSFGIPFDILDLHRVTLQKFEWLSLILKAPLQVLRPLPKEKIYVVEADADRPQEGKFLAELLKPEIVLWVSSSRTHSMNFDSLVSAGKFKTVEEAIAYEYGWFAVYCNSLLVIDGDCALMTKQISRSKAKVLSLKKAQLFKSYSINKHGTQYNFKNKQYAFNYLLPEEVFLSIAMCEETMDYLKLPMDRTFKKFQLPPGRGSLFEGVNGLTIIDSCYNANLSSMSVILNMFQTFPASKKWAVIGDMLELGEEEKEEHKKLAGMLVTLDAEHIIFLGPRVMKYTLPEFKKQSQKNIAVDAFENPKEVLDFILQHVQGGETILFKGARFMEGIIEHLLKNKSDVALLARREKIWEIRRKQWGL
ncbi:MAG: glutamate ligase domain-containing protein [Candidatus Levyibacteriota bacterium]